MLNSKQVFYESVDACTNAYLSYVKEARSATYLMKTIDLDDGLGTDFSYRREDGDLAVDYETRVSLETELDDLTSPISKTIDRVVVKRVVTVLRDGERVTTFESIDRSEDVVKTLTTLVGAFLKIGCLDDEDFEKARSLLT